MPKILTTEADPGFLPAREPGLRGAEWVDSSEIVPPTTQILEPIGAGVYPVVLPTGPSGLLNQENDIVPNAGRLTVPADGDYILEIVVVHSTTVL